MTSDMYDLVELCDLADVTPRTVRYYVQQGVLPSPATRGPGARYDRGHLDRLQLVKRLQREHLPLSEIRSRLAGLSDAAVAALLREPARVERHASALDYVRDVLAGRPSSHHAPGAGPAAAPAASPAASPGIHLSRVRARPEPGVLAEAASLYESDAASPAPVPGGRAQDAADAMSGAPPAPQGPARSTWERVALAPDVELHVRRPLSRAQNKLVDRLIERARTLFTDPS